MKDTRVGSGFDIHRLEAGVPFKLGGVKVESPVGPRGHSDGDVLLHALCDAMLGAAGLGDIGDYFPDSDPRWKGVESRLFVERANEKLLEGGFRVENVDATVFLETPKLGRLKANVRGAVATILGIPSDRVNLKAKTMEGLGPIGASQAVAAMVTVLVSRQSVGVTSPD